VPRSDSPPPEVIPDYLRPLQYSHSPQVFDELISRGVTLAFCETWNPTFDEDSGIVVQASSRLKEAHETLIGEHDSWSIWIGRRIKLCDDDPDGSLFMEDLLDLIFSEDDYGIWITYKEDEDQWVTRPEEGPEITKMVEVVEVVDESPTPERRRVLSEKKRAQLPANERLRSEPTDPIPCDLGKGRPVTKFVQIRKCAKRPSLLLFLLPEAQQRSYGHNGHTVIRSYHQQILVLINTKICPSPVSLDTAIRCPSSRTMIGYTRGYRHCQITRSSKAFASSVQLFLVATEQRLGSQKLSWMTSDGMRMNWCDCRLKIFVN